MFLPGQKVVCVNDAFSEVAKSLYTSLPVRGVAYAVRSTKPCLEPGDLCVYLIGLENPRSSIEPYLERGFDSKRFRPLDSPGPVG